MVAPAGTNPCCVCGTQTKTRCSACATYDIQVAYCSPAHQKLIWPYHKHEVLRLSTRGIPSPLSLLGLPEPTVASIIENWQRLPPGSFRTVLVPLMQNATALAQRPSDGPKSQQGLLTRTRSGSHSALADSLGRMPHPREVNVWWAVAAFERAVMSHAGDDPQYRLDQFRQHALVLAVLLRLRDDKGAEKGFGDDCVLQALKIMLESLNGVFDFRNKENRDAMINEVLSFLDPVVEVVLRPVLRPLSDSAFWTLEVEYSDVQWM
ncbi:hypothetical protein JCM10450v2_003548 [Rhodotorula kratochvilovae]